MRLTMHIFVLLTISKEKKMKKIFALLTIALIGISAADCMAGDGSYKNSDEYKKMDNDMRADLQSCLSNTKMSTRDCIKQTKEKYKEQKKMIKKEYKHKMKDVSITH